MSHPTFDELCGCVLIPIPPGQESYFDSVFANQKERVMRRYYAMSKAFSADGDCRTCDGTGVIQSEPESAASE